VVEPDRSATLLAALARIPSPQIAAILAGAACFSRAMLDEALDGEDWTARVIAAGREQSGGGE